MNASQLALTFQEYFPQKIHIVIMYSRAVQLIEIQFRCRPPKIMKI